MWKALLRVSGANRSERRGFHTPSGTVSCTTAQFGGNTSVATTTTLTLRGNYGGCTAFGFLGATVHTNGCTYLFHLTSNTVSPYTSTVDVVCPAGKVIEVTGSFGCVTTVGPQTGLTGVSLTNNGTKTTRSLKVGLKVKGVHGVANASCPTPGTFTSGELTGEATVRGYYGAGPQQGLWVA